MDKLVIQGPNRLEGTVRVSGAKNAALPIMAATLLTNEKCTIKNVPALRDISTMIKILRAMGARVDVKGDAVIIFPKTCKSCVAPYKFVSTMRASICLLGALIGRFRFAEVSFPGGCVIGPRPVDLHIKGIRALGVDVKVEKGYIIANAKKKLKGNYIYLGGNYGSSVLATANTIMAAVLAKGITVIENAACEPEIVDLEKFLLKMGARIKGIGTHTLAITGVKKLSGAAYSVIPDRIEAGTYMAAAAATGGDVRIKDARMEDMLAVADKLREAGVRIRALENGIRVKGIKNLRPVDISTLPYPGFPTDMQAQMMALMSVARGISVITEKIFTERFIHISELNRMGADIKLEGSSAIVNGVKGLSGAPVMASDLRASAALVIGGLVARGRTEIHRIYHLDRGYENLDEKLVRLGAKVSREKE
jgi:UDP-N-acetylglucosamine 1-carboxyvinyltransferase